MSTRGGSVNLSSASNEVGSQVRPGAGVARFAAEQEEVVLCPQLAQQGFANQTGGAGNQESTHDDLLGAMRHPECGPATSPGPEKTNRQKPVL